MSIQKKRNALLVLLVVLALAGAGWWLWQNGQHTKLATGTTFLMDTVVEYKLYGPKGETAMAAIEQELRQIEREMSLYIEDSPISRLNAQGSAPISEQTYTLLRNCQTFYDLSGGLFDVSIAPLTTLWDITGEHPTVPANVDISAALALVDGGEISLSSEADTYAAALNREGMQIDLGGVAKGFACGPARAAAIAQGITSGYVSIGGNIMVIGKKPNGEDFRVGVRDPRGGANDYIAVVTLPDSTMATSGDYERYFEQDGQRYHHILDPRTGYPADNGLISVSIISEDGAYADFLSTYVFIAGKDHLAQLMELHSGSVDGYPPCGVIAIDRDKNVYISDNLRGRVTSADESGTYHFPEGWT